MSRNNPPFPLTALRLRFHCIAETTLQLGMQAGSNLRGALVGVMRRAACGGDPSDPEHLVACPVCWLVAANEHPGQERRGYALAPPIGVANILQPKERFDFNISLFGNAIRYLPYFVLAVPEAGRVGVGPGRGRFMLREIISESPLGEAWVVLKEGENLVRPPAEPVRQADFERAAADLAARLEGKQPKLRMEFLTPLRLILNEQLLKSPDFGAIFNHVLRRLDELADQFAGGYERPLEERQHLWGLANEVRLVESQTRWVDVSSGSNRTGQPTWISGMVGMAWYSAPLKTWQALLPWLLWGRVAQVGKDTSKGNGVYTLSLA